MAARPRLTYANVVATIALVVAMSTGGAYAATLITTSQIADGAVTTPKLRGSAVKPSKIADGAVSRAKIASGAVNSAKLAPNAVTDGKVADESLTGADVADGTLSGDDIKDSSLTGEDIVPGSIGFHHVNQALHRPRAFGLVKFDGALESGYRTNLTQANITVPEGQEGMYCIHGLDFVPQAVSVTASWMYSGPGMATAGFGDTSECPQGTQVMVLTYGILNYNMTRAPKSFLISMWP